MPRCAVCGADHANCGGPAVLRYAPVGAENETMDAPYTADRRLYLDKDGKVVEEGDPARVELLVAPGRQIPATRARELGLMDREAAAPAPAPAQNAELESLRAENERLKAENAELQASLSSAPPAPADTAPAAPPQGGQEAAKAPASANASPKAAEATGKAGDKSGEKKG